jgi:hypothetical protein
VNHCQVTKSLEMRIVLASPWGLLLSFRYSITQPWGPPVPSPPCSAFKNPLKRNGTLPNPWESAAVFLATWPAVSRSDSIWPSFLLLQNGWALVLFNYQTLGKLRWPRKSHPRATTQKEIVVDVIASSITPQFQVVRWSKSRGWGIGCVSVPVGQPTL